MRKGNINFEGNRDNLGRGEEESALTDGAMDLGGDMGVDGGLMDNEDEIGLIFEFKGKETKYA